MPRKSRHSWRRMLAFGVCGIVSGCASTDDPAFLPPNTKQPKLAAARDAAQSQPRANPPIKSCRPVKSSSVANVSATVLADERPSEDAVTEPLAIPDPLESFDDRPIYPLSFSDALAQAGGNNPRVHFAQGRIQAAYARLEAAQVLWLPTIRAGSSYSQHEGVLQPAPGRIDEVDRFATYQGFGTRAIGSGPPAIPGLSMEFHLADACFQPKIAGQRASASNHAFTAESNDVLLDTALAYLDLLEARQQKAIAEETLGRAKTLADLTATFAREGEGPQADAERAATELTIRQINIQRSIEGIEVAEARLAQQLSMDPLVDFEPRESVFAPIELVESMYDPQELVAMGLSNRHELAESRHLVAAACERLRREKAAPLVPSLILRMSYGGFGGGFDDSLDDYDERIDLDAGAFWEVRNLGFGERAARREAAAEVLSAQATQVRLMDQVAREVVEAHAQIRARKGQIRIAETAIESAQKAFDHEVERIRQGQGLPIETLQSIQALDAARREYLRSVVEYNEAQFRLHRALGWPASLAPEVN